MGKSRERLNIRDVIVHPKCSEFDCNYGQFRINCNHNTLTQQRRKVSIKKATAQFANGSVAFYE